MNVQVVIQSSGLAFLFIPNLFIWQLAQTSLLFSSERKFGVLKDEGPGIILLHQTS